MAPSDIDFTLYYIALIALLVFYGIFFVFFLRKYEINNKGNDRKDYMHLYYCLVFLFMGLGRLFLALFDVVTEFNRINYNDSNFYWWKIGSSLQIIGIGFLFYMMEKRVMKGRDKYLLLLLYAGFTIFGMTLTVIELATTFVVIGMLMAIYIPIAYMYIAIKSDGIVRKKAVIIFVGFVIAIFSALLTGEQLMAILTNISTLERIQIHPIAFGLQIIGLTFLFFGFK